MQIQNSSKPSYHVSKISRPKVSCLPQCFKDARSIAIYERKGDRTECGSYRGISLLSIVGKLLACILLPSLRIFGEEHATGESVQQ